MSASDAALPGKGRRQLVLLVVLFLLPPLGAWMAWKVMDAGGVAATTNAGQLISPARPLTVVGLQDASGAAIDAAAMRGRWTYVLFDDGTCSSGLCDKQLYLTRQTRLAMNKDVQRVQRLLILKDAPGPALAQRFAEQHPDLVWATGDQRAQSFLRDFTDAGFGSSGRHFFLVDPLGNLMMVYDLSVPAKGLMKDLQKLLKVSQIG